MHHVLIIEDDRNIVELLTIHLNDLACEVTATSNGQDGLSIARERRFDLIILDIMLPGLNGMEICRRIRQADRHTPHSYAFGKIGGDRQGGRAGDGGR